VGLQSALANLKEQNKRWKGEAVDDDAMRDASRYACSVM
jgi:hypothetical protein